MTHYKDVDGERLLCWGRPGDKYNMYLAGGREEQDWFDAMLWAIEESYQAEYPAKVHKITYEKDYGVDRSIGAVLMCYVSCDDDYSVAVDWLVDKP